MWGPILPSISFLLNRSFILSHMAEQENYRSGHCFAPASEKPPPEPGEGITGERKGSNKIGALRGFQVFMNSFYWGFYSKQSQELVGSYEMWVICWDKV